MDRVQRDIGRTLRECARELDIRLRTPFRWRHVVLNALRQLDEETPRERGSAAPLSGKSRHHVCVLTPQDRTGQRFARVIDRGSPKHRNVARGLAPRLTPSVAGGVDFTSAMSRRHTARARIRLFIT